MGARASFYAATPAEAGISKSGLPTKTTILTVSRDRPRRRNQTKRNLPLASRTANKLKGKWKLRTTKNYQNKHLRRMQAETSLALKRLPLLASREQTFVSPALKGLPPLFSALCVALRGRVSTVHLCFRNRKVSVATSASFLSLSNRGGSG